MPPRSCRSFCARSTASTSNRFLIPSSIPSRSTRATSPSVSRHKRLDRQWSRGCTRHFSSTTAFQARRLTHQRQRMHAWLQGPGAVFKQGRDGGGTTYLNAYDSKGRQLSEPSGGEGGQKNVRPEDLMPFPLNPYFRSQSVLGEAERGDIYKRVVELGQSVREVSQALHVDMNRVGAVVRLMAIEKQWKDEGRSLASVYSKTVLSMLPQTSFETGAKNRVEHHEPINNLPVHQATLAQVFHPTSESRHFTRQDAAEIFRPGLLPADDRIPHPDMIINAREASGKSGEGVVPQGERRERQKRRWAAEAEARHVKRERDEQRAAARTKLVEGRRWDFKLENVVVDHATGTKLGRLSAMKAMVAKKKFGDPRRNPDGIGWRYGFPLPDRKKGQVKIPTSVEP